MKLKPMKLKIIKYNKIKFNLDITRPIAKDTDKDGIPNYLDCEPFDNSKQGLLHDWLKKQRLLKERKQMAKLDIEPIQSEQEYFNEELSKSETGIEHFKGQVEEMAGEMKGNIREGFKGTDKNFGRVAKDYTKRAEQTRRQPGVQQHSGGRAVHYLIPSWVACRKMFHDTETGQPSSIPKFKRDVYKPYSPSFASGMFTPKRTPNPLWLVKKQRERELVRLYLRLKSREGID